MLHKVLMGLLMAGLAAIATAETVYKWVDSAGQIHYTDLPPKQDGAKILSVSHGTGTYDDEQGSDDDFSDETDNQSNDPSGTTTPEPPVSREAVAAVQDDVAKAKVEQCKQAQDRYQRYIDSRRLYREENGQRVYLTDQELTDARARAKQAVDDYCS